MTKMPFPSLNSLRNRMLLFFLVVILFVVLITLQLVRSATYSHSTEQLLSQTQTSASVVEDKVENRADLLLRAADNLSSDFTMKQYIGAASEDPESLFVAMQNHQNRINADMFLVLDGQQNLLTSSIKNNLLIPQQPEHFIQSGISWFQIDGKVYLMKGAPVKFVERSRRTDAWIFMGYDTSGLISEEIRRLTDLQVSLLVPSQANRALGSTFETDQLSQLVAQQIDYDLALHQIDLGREEYVYTTATFGELNDAPVYLLLAARQDKAYLSYNSMQVQLIGLLVIAGILSLIAALLLSRGITGPLNRLAQAANIIRQGNYVTDLPASSTTEVDALSMAIGEMQEGIQTREKQINHLAYYDDLTGLPNRNQFSSHLEQGIAEQQGSNLLVLMLDIDRFKDINDTVGHETGDLLIQHISKRIAAFNEMPAFLARLGGDEFGMVLKYDGNQVLESLVHRVACIFDQPFNIAGLVLDVDCSIGASVFPDDATTASGLMQCADIALYSCKGTHHHYAIYKPELNKHSVQRLNLMSELKGALQEGQLQLYYQPKLSLQEQQISSVECLIRWIHPEHGFIPPDEFIPLAEQTGAIRHVTHWGLRTALQQQKLWRQQGHSITVAVNISAIDLIDMALPTLVSNLLSEFGCEPEMLTLEVTESAIMADPESALSALNTLKRMGIKLSIDDFGTGYSSMAQLKGMPVHELKIDKAFVLELAKSQDDKVMVNTMVSLAKNLSLQTVAEGVEDEETLDYLAEIGCTKAQGFYLSRPLPADQFDSWLAEFNQSEKAEL